MIIRDTYQEKKVRKEINDQVGTKFSALERLRMRGVGSQRFDIVSSSAEISNLLSQDKRPDACNIELRRKGIIVRFQSRIHTYAWTIPFHQLQVYRNGSQLSIYGPKEFVKCLPSHNSSLDILFLQKIMRLKGEANPDFRDVAK